MHVLCFVKAGEDTGVHFLTLISQNGAQPATLRIKECCCSLRYFQDPAQIPKAPAHRSSA